MIKAATFFCIYLLWSQSAHAQMYGIGRDTISQGGIGCELLENCGFTKIKNVAISNFYTITDSLSLYINSDNTHDILLVLSPQRLEAKLPDSCQNKSNGRLLVALISCGRGYRIGFINKNVILGTEDYMSEPFHGIKKINNGIRLIFEYGSIIYYRFEFDFLISNGNLWLRKRKLWAFNKGNPRLEKRASTLYKTSVYNLKTFVTSRFLIEADLIEKRGSDL